MVFSDCQILLLLYRHRGNTRIFPVIKILYPVKIQFLSFTCEHITVVMATSVSANRKRASQHHFYEIYMPYCYNVQNTYKRYLFSLFFDQNSNVQKIYTLSG